jgi:HicA toxin of bacterial toxin-antitoxin,
MILSLIMRKKHRKTLEAIYRHPISANIKWLDIEALSVAVGAEVEERSGSRVSVVLGGTVHVFHRPHPNRSADKGAVRDVREMLIQARIKP